MKDIKIIVTKKVASVEGTPIIVCGNSDYTLSFTFDDEWSNEQNKVARFNYSKNGLKRHIDEPIKNDTCKVPKLLGIGLVKVGVYAGDLKTTTEAKIKCHKSILCDDADTMDEPFKNLYEELKKAVTNLGKGVLKKEDVLNSKRDPTNEYQVYSAEVITELVWELVSLLGEKADKTELAEKLTKYTELATDKEYYSAKAVNEIIEDIESSGSDYILPIGGDELGGVKNGGNVVINEDGTMTAPESEVTDEQVSSAVSEWIEANPDKVTTVQDGSITQEKLSDELVTKLGLEPNHHLTEVKLTLRMGKYNNFWDGVNSGTSTSTELFETPQYIKIVNNHTQDIKASGIRFADILDYENANFINDLNSSLLHQFGYLKDTIPMGEEMIFPTFEWGSKSRKYMQIYFQPSAQHYQAPNNIEVYAIYDTWKPTYKIPNDEESKEVFLEDLPMKWVVTSNTGGSNCGVFCAVPYYPNFTYHIRGGCYGTTLMNTLSVYGIYDDISVFDVPQKCIIGMSGNVSSINAFPLSQYYGKTTQYDTSVNGGVDANYQWAYFKTPTEEELTGLKWLLIQFSQEAGSDGKNVLGRNITEEYVNYVLENSKLFNGKSQYQYISRWQDKDAPRKHTTQLRKINPTLNDEGSIYQSFNTLNEYSPMANSKWVLFGDSLTDTYGGHDKSSEYFASKIANEFNMNLDNRAKSGSNIYKGGSGNYVSVSGIVMLDAYLAEIEAGTTPQADYITVAFGTNTFKAQMGTNDDTSETNTSVYGATKYFIEKIREKVPNAVLGFVLSPRQDWGSNDAQKLRDVDGAREVIREVCEDYGVPYIDMAKESGITVAMLPDGIHIKNDQSQKLYYHAMRRFMMGL